jgi:hypothetical protein
MNKIHYYLCEDGEMFSTNAESEREAFRVFKAERPGKKARYLGCAEVPEKKPDT